MNKCVAVLHQSLQSLLPRDYAPGARPTRLTDLLTQKNHPTPPALLWATTCYLIRLGIQPIPARIQSP